MGQFVPKLTAAIVADIDAILGNKPVRQIKKDMENNTRIWQSHESSTKTMSAAPRPLTSIAMQLGLAYTCIIHYANVMDAFWNSFEYISQKSTDFYNC